jgi:LuxR family maltose regulon positive regulatory protein
VVVHHARGLLRFGQGRLEEALAAFTRAQDLQPLLGGEHIFGVDARARALQVRIRMGEGEAVRIALAALSREQRERGAARNALAALELEAGRPDRAVDALAPVIDGSAPALVPRWTLVEALVLDAAARDRLGDRRATEASLEAALELAEPEGLVLSFMLWPNPDLLERHPRHRSAHGALIATILDLLAGHATAPPLLEELSDAELRVVRYLPSNLTASEIASELVVSANTVRTHMRHIYAKLDAHTRSEAVARARELGLVARSTARG